MDSFISKHIITEYTTIVTILLLFRSERDFWESSTRGHWINLTKTLLNSTITPRIPRIRSHLKCKAHGRSIISWNSEDHRQSAMIHGEHPSHDLKDRANAAEVTLYSWLSYRFSGKNGNSKSALIYFLGKAE